MHGSSEDDWCAADSDDCLNQDDNASEENWCDTEAGNDTLVECGNPPDDEQQEDWICGGGASSCDALQVQSGGPAELTEYASTVYTPAQPVKNRRSLPLDPDFRKRLDRGEPVTSHDVQNHTAKLVALIVEPTGTKRGGLTT